MVLDSQLQTPLGLQDQDAPAVKKTCRSVLISSGCLGCQNPSALTKTSVWRSVRTEFAHAGGAIKRYLRASISKKWSDSSS